VPAQSVLQLRVALCEVEPTVWRRLLVPGTVNLNKLHLMLQAAMGWEDSHLHAFEIGESRYGMQFDDFPPDELDESAVTMENAISDTDRFTYEYDFGDSWTHEIVVEDRWQSPVGLKFAVCVDGANRCPPENCGGAGGYELLLEALADPTHPQHNELAEWIPEPIDPTEFDLAFTNARLQAVR